MSVYYMGEVAGMPQADRAEVEAYLGQNAEGVTLGTVQDGNSIRLTMMGLLQNATLKELYMQANRDSQKVKNIQETPTAEIAVSNNYGYVILTCTVKLVDDEKLKAAKWEEWMAQYHANGPTSPNYILLQFIPQSIRAMI